MRVLILSKLQITQKLDVEWKFIYVGDSHDAKHDQVLDSICMDNIDFGANEFTWEVLAIPIFSGFFKKELKFRGPIAKFRFPKTRNFLNSLFFALKPK